MSASKSLLEIGPPQAGRYPVESRQPAGASHTYWVDPNSLRCDCPAGRRRTACKHLHAVLALLEGRSV